MGKVKTETIPVIVGAAALGAMPPHSIKGNLKKETGNRDMWDGPHSSTTPTKFQHLFLRVETWNECL